MAERTEEKAKLSMAFMLFSSPILKPGQDERPQTTGGTTSHVTKNDRRKIRNWKLEGRKDKTESK